MRCFPHHFFGFYRLLTMVQLVLERWAVSLKKTATLRSWAQFVSRQGTLLKMFKFNKKTQTKLLNVLKAAQPRSMCETLRSDW